MSTSNEGAKPCPFCGEEPNVKQYDEWNGMGGTSTYHSIGCSNPQCATQPCIVDTTNEPGAYEAWNTRASDQDPDTITRELDALRTQVERARPIIEAVKVYLANAPHGPLCNLYYGDNEVCTCEMSFLAKALTTAGYAIKAEAHNATT